MACAKQALHVFEQIEQQPQAEQSQAEEEERLGGPGGNSQQAFIETPSFDVASEHVPGAPGDQSEDDEPDQVGEDVEADDAARRQPVGEDLNLDMATARRDEGERHAPRSPASGSRSARRCRESIGRRTSARSPTGRPARRPARSQASSTSSAAVSTRWSTGRRGSPRPTGGWGSNYRPSAPARAGITSTDSRSAAVLCVALLRLLEMRQHGLALQALGRHRLEPRISKALAPVQHDLHDVVGHWRISTACPSMPAT
jgi:hypothetical protein